MDQSKYIDESEPDEARLRQSGVPVWALIEYLKAASGNKALVAHDYDISLDEVRAAIAYYEEHRQALDTRLLANIA